MKVAVFDLDGVLADNTYRLHNVTQPDKKDNNWSEFYKGIPKDKINLPIKHLLFDLYKRGHYIIILTGREGTEQVRMDTEKWLIDYGIPYKRIIYRREKNYYPAPTFKKEIMKHLITAFGIENILVFEDDAKVIKEYQELGITCCQVSI